MFWPKPSFRARLARVAVCALIGVVLGVSWAALSRQVDRGPAGIKGNAVHALSELKAGTQLTGELIYGTDLEDITVVFRASDGRRFEHHPQPGTPGYTTAAVQAAFAKQLDASVVPQVVLVIQQQAGERLAVFRREQDSFLALSLPTADAVPLGDTR